MTSRQTKASRGRVVSMLRPKHRRARLTIGLVRGKLLRMLALVREVKVRKPARARSAQKRREMVVL